MLVRDRPRLDLDIDIETPGGRHVHWSESDSDPAHVPSGLTFTSTMPGGFAELNATLPRKRGLVYDDLERLSTVTVYGPGGAVAWQGRLERAPRSSGDKLSVSPGAVGWQSHLDDDKSAAMVYVDADIRNWAEASRTERLRVLTANQVFGNDYTATAERGLSFQGVTGKAIPDSSQVSIWYFAPSGVTVAKVMYKGTRRNTTNVSADLRAQDSDSIIAPGDGYTLTWDDTLRTQTLSTARRYLAFRSFASAAHTPAAAVPYLHAVSKVGVYADHGLTSRSNGTDPDGFYASDVVAHAISTWCPLLNYTEGAGGSIRPSSFVIPHLTFPERTTAAEIIRGATRFGLQDWAVWDNKTFYWHDRGELGRSWRARASESQLEETGADTARLYNGALVEYRDVDGSTKTVGPTGSGADTESTDLVDDDTENPANQLGIRRWTKLSMGVSTAAGATEVGRRFLEETKALDSSGRARIVGHVQDDRGVWHPAWRIRAGDTISFVDAGDTSARRIVSASYSHADRSCSVDLDAPPDSMAALLERLDVSIVSLGL